MAQGNRPPDTLPVPLLPEMLSDSQCNNDSSDDGSIYPPIHKKWVYDDKKYKGCWKTSLVYSTTTPQMPKIQPRIKGLK